MTTNLMLGLHDPVPGAVKLRFADYIDYLKLQVPAGDFGHYDLVKDWGMLANDVWGCCAWSGIEHQTMLSCAEGGRPVSFSDATTVTNYEATGFNPAAGASGQNSTDNGTAVDFLADYWLNTGIVDDNGTRHKIVGYAALKPGDLHELWIAISLFQSVGLGFALPDSAQQQFAEGQPWDVVPGANIVGGHYVPAFGRKGGMGMGVTWGQLQPFTPAFYKEYNNQGIVCFSEEMLVQAKSIDGIDDVQLRKDLQILQSVS